jgi:hypothetical protein
MRLYSIVCLLVGLPMFGMGLIGTVITLADPEEIQLEISLKDFIVQRPSHEVIKLTDCALNFTESAGYLYNNDIQKLNTMYIPLRPPGTSPDTPAHAVLITSKRKYLDVAIELSRAKTAEQFDEVSRDNLQVLAEIRDIEGRVFRGTFGDDNPAELVEFRAKLAPGYVVIHERRKIPPLVCYCLLGGGVLALLLVRLTTGKKSATQNPTRAPQKI